MICSYTVLDMERKLKSLRNAIVGILNARAYRHGCRKQHLSRLRRSNEWHEDVQNIMDDFKMLVLRAPRDAVAGLPDAMLKCVTMKLHPDQLGLIVPAARLYTAKHPAYAHRMVTLGVLRRVTVPPKPKTGRTQVQAE